MRDARDSLSITSDTRPGSAMQHGRRWLARWNHVDTTDMAAAPVTGFGCAPSASLSLFCALHLAARDSVGDYAHFRTAVAAERSSTVQPCNRPCIKKQLDAFIDALSAREPTRVRLAPDARITENGRETTLGDGLWKSAGALGDYRVYAIDADSASGAIQTVVQDAQQLVQVQVRLKIGTSGISQVEMLVAREGDTCCWAPQQLDSLSGIFDAPVAADNRMSRAELVAAAESYFAALHDANTPKYRRPPIALNMNRYENGQQTTNATYGPPIIRESAITQLDQGSFGHIAVLNRRYPVVDVENGTVLGIVMFEYPGTTRPAEIISEFFKIDGGAIREIRAVMVRQPTSGWR